MARYSHDLLINQETGAIDWSYLKEHALLRAQREFGGSNPPPSWLRDALRALRTNADMMAAQWRMDRGLADNRPSTPMSQYLADSLAQYGAD